MIIFWVLAAGLIGLALLFILPPLLAKTAEAKPDVVDEDQINLAVFRQQIEELDADLAAGNLEQEQYDSARRDLEKELLLDIAPSAREPKPAKSGRWVAAVLAPAVPAVALALYFNVGDPGAVDQRAAAQAATVPSHGTGQDLPSMEVLVGKLAERMEKEPDNLQGWVMLGRSYLAMKRPEDAVKAYDKARGLAPDDPDVLLGYAESVAKAEGGLDGRAAELVAAALEIAPANPNALWMMGLVEYQKGNAAGAIEHWRKLESLLEPGGEDAATVRSYITQAAEQAGLPAPEAAPPEPAVEQEQTAEPAVAETAAAQPQAAAGQSIRVEVSLADALRSRASPEDTVFIFARALEGPPMPLAAIRVQVKELPVSVTLDDGMAMMPQMRLSNFAQVVVGARISSSGNAMPQSGDLQGEVKPVTPGQADAVSVIIDSVRP